MTILGRRIVKTSNDNNDNYNDDEIDNYYYHKTKCYFTVHIVSYYVITL